MMQMGNLVWQEGHTFTLENKKFFVMIFFVASELSVPVRYHCLAAGALCPVAPGVLRSLLDEDVHGELLVLLPLLLGQLLQRLQLDEGLFKY